MDTNFENIIPWNGANDTGRDVRLKLERNFAKIGVNFHELDGKFSTIDELFDLIAQELEGKLSRVNPDTALELITFLKGIISKGAIYAEDIIQADGGIRLGAFLSGLTGSGGYLGADGRLEARSLKLWETLDVPELRYNRVDVTTGDKWSAPGGGLIESVEMDVDDSGNVLPIGTATLKLEPGEIGAVAFDDLCMGIFHFNTGNSTVNHDDGRGNRYFAGFTTIYFRILEILESGLNRKFRFALRTASDAYPNPAAPCAMMNFVCFGNVTNKDRQKSCYQTRTYTRYLKNVDSWEFSLSNIAMQSGDLSNMQVFGIDMTGYSMFVDSLYFTGKIEQLKQIIDDTLGAGDLRMEIESSGGNLFIDDNIDTVLTAKVMQYFKNVTSNVTRWEWSRRSGTDQVNIASDALWADRNKHARESVHITSADVPTDSVTFICDAWVGGTILRESLTI